MSFWKGKQGNRLLNRNYNLSSLSNLDENSFSTKAAKLWEELATQKYQLLEHRRIEIQAVSSILTKTGVISIQFIKKCKMGQSEDCYTSGLTTGVLLGYSVSLKDLSRQNMYVIIAAAFIASFCNCFYK